MEFAFSCDSYFGSQSCYNDLKDGEIIALAETAVRKADLKRKKNDEQAEASVGVDGGVAIWLVLKVVEVKVVFG